VLGQRVPPEPRFLCACRPTTLRLPVILQEDLSTSTAGAKSLTQVTFVEEKRVAL
jgi:hypothetical protein